MYAEVVNAIVASVQFVLTSYEETNNKDKQGGLA